MTQRIAAINAFRPRLDLGKTVQKPELVRQLSRATGMNEGFADQALKETRDWIIENNRAGRPVKIEGLGTWIPKIGLDGKFSIDYRPDQALLNGLNTPDTFSGDIIHRENIGMTAADLVALWNEAHPEDPVIE